MLSILPIAGNRATDDAEGFGLRWDHSSRYDVSGAASAHARRTGYLPTANFAPYRGVH